MAKCFIEDFKTILLNSQNLKRFKKTYAEAIKSGTEIFKFNDGIQDHEIFTPYAKYLIEYAELKLKRR